MKNGRTIRVGGTKFVWRAGRDTTVIRREDNTVFAKIPNHVLLGISPDTFDRGQWKRSSDGMVTPKYVAEAIEKELRSRSAS